jgi:hypothetical protein
LGIEHGEKQRADCRNQRSEIRRQRSGINLISDLRLLTSMIDDFYAFYGFNGFKDLPLTGRFSRNSETKTATFG